jgi:hypothetical protein
MGAKLPRTAAIKHFRDKILGCKKRDDAYRTVICAKYNLNLTNHDIDNLQNILVKKFDKIKN